MRQVGKSMPICDKCEKIFVNRASLTRHRRNVHNEILLKSSTATLKCSLCQEAHENNVDFIRHIEDKHDFKSKFEDVTFKTFDEFEDWKRSLEIENKAKFIIRNSRKGVTYYRCNRSGPYRVGVSPENRKRSIKNQGSRKIEFHCPASINTKILPGGYIDVTAEMSHFGHEKQLVHIPRSSVKKTKTEANKKPSVSKSTRSKTGKLKTHEESSQINMTQIMEENQELVTTLLNMISTDEEASILNKRLKNIIHSIKTSRRKVESKNPPKIDDVQNLHPQQKCVVEKIENANETIDLEPLSINCDIFSEYEVLSTSDLIQPAIMEIVIDNV